MPTSQLLKATAQRPLDWHDSLSGPPDLCSIGRLGERALLRRWHDTAPDMEQPPLDDHFVTLHLVGAKRITRSSGHRSIAADVECGSISFTPAGRGYSWSTAGPIGFAHLYLHPDLIDRVIREDFDRGTRSIDFVDQIGRASSLLGALMSGIINELESPSAASRLVLSSLLNSMIVQVLTEFSTIGRHQPTVRHMMSPSRLRRVIDFMDANLAMDLDLQELASVAGSSPFHFSRTFRAATGLPPYRFLIQRRIEFAKTLLVDRDLPIETIAANCGFHSRSQFAAMFRRALGINPARYRREH